MEHIEGNELTVIACGLPAHPSLEATRKLNAEGRSVGVIDVATVKPLDGKAVLRAARRSRILMTADEHNIPGGLGSAVAESVADEGCGVQLVRHGIHDECSLIAPPTHLYAHHKLDAAGIEEIARSALAKI
ncbi:MAG: transketolase C-terminal domain-containing protein [Bosea sp. (in: a-proteobacteria)]|nr:transketolase C-terminal domain-containing protein [Bosea sp. (in: a-proteobacteria)]